MVHALVGIPCVLPFVEKVVENNAFLEINEQADNMNIVVDEGMDEFPSLSMKMNLILWIKFYVHLVGTQGQVLCGEPVSRPIKG